MKKKLWIKIPYTPVHLKKKGPERQDGIFTSLDLSLSLSIFTAASPPQSQKRIRFSFLFSAEHTVNDYF
jgi:hypothetical protein